MYDPDHLTFLERNVPSFGRPQRLFYDATAKTGHSQLRSATNVAGFWTGVAAGKQDVLKEYRDNNIDLIIEVVATDGYSVLSYGVNQKANGAGSNDGAENVTLQVMQNFAYPTAA